MTQLVFKGDPGLLANFDQSLTEIFSEAGLADQVEIESELEHLAPPPGQMGFGEEIRKVFVGLSEVLEASKDAIEIVAKGIAERLVQNKIHMKVSPDGTIDLRASGDLQDAATVAEQISAIISAKQG